jgi:hypothetical protein
MDDPLGCICNFDLRSQLFEVRDARSSRSYPFDAFFAFSDSDEDIYLSRWKAILPFKPLSLSIWHFGECKTEFFDDGGRDDQRR